MDVPWLELTGAAALLVATLLLGVVGESLATGLLTIVRGPWIGPIDVALDVPAFIAHLRATAWSILGPLGLLMLGLVAAGVAAHQAQVGLLWAPALMAPDVARLWGGGGGRGLAARAGRGAWAIAKSVVVLAVAAWAIRSQLDGLAGLGNLDTPALARAWAEAVRELLGTLAASALGLGLVDYAMQRQRFAAMLRLTPEQSRARGPGGRTATPRSAAVDRDSPALPGGGMRPSCSRGRRSRSSGRRG